MIFPTDERRRDRSTSPHAGWLLRVISDRAAHVWLRRIRRSLRCGAHACGRAARRGSGPQ